MSSEYHMYDREYAEKNPGETILGGIVSLIGMFLLILLLASAAEGGQNEFRAAPAKPAKPKVVRTQPAEVLQIVEFKRTVTGINNDNVKLIRIDGCQYLIFKDKIIPHSACPVHQANMRKSEKKIDQKD